MPSQQRLRQTDEEITYNLFRSNSNLYWWKDKKMPTIRRLQPNDGNPQSLLEGALACSPTNSMEPKSRREGSRAAESGKSFSPNGQTELFYGGTMSKPTMKSIRKVSPPKGKWRLVRDTGAQGVWMKRKLQRVS